MDILNFVHQALCWSTYKSILRKAIGANTPWAIQQSKDTFVSLCLKKLKVPRDVRIIIIAYYRSTEFRIPHGFVLDKRRVAESIVNYPNYEWRQELGVWQKYWIDPVALEHIHWYLPCTTCFLPIKHPCCGHENAFECATCNGKAIYQCHRCKRFFCKTHVLPFDFWETSGDEWIMCDVNHKYGRPWVLFK